MKLGEICSRITDGKHGDCKNSPNSGYYFLSAKDIFEKKLNYEKAREIEEDDFFETHRRTNLQPGDLLLTNSGTIGRVAIATDDPKTYRTTFQKSVAILKPKLTIVDPLFLYYVLLSEKKQIQEMAGGTTQQNLLLRDINNIDISLPPLPEQRAIAAILGALDDKIELNRRMNRTLEEMAWVVYKDFVKDEKGIETKIGDVLSIVGGSTPSTANPEFWEDGDICWATPKDLALLKSPILLDTKSKITKLGLQQISSGLLPVGTVLLSSRAPIGYLAIAHVPVAINQGFIAIKCTDEIPNYFILNWLKDNMDEIIGRANGTTFMEISKSNFRPIQIAIPPFEKMSEFVKIVEPIYQRIVASLEEINTITEIRDTLLPKLMTGQMQASLIFESDDKHGSNFQLNIGHERET